MRAPPDPWTCPFCPLLCDAFGVAAGDDGRWALRGSDCPRAAAGLARFGSAPATATPTLRGTPCDLSTAVAAAARLLAASAQPLFGGLATDVAGARALYPLACACGAICDAGGGDALTQGVRALQDRGGYSTTLAEVRTRAELLLSVGGPLPSAHGAYPEFCNRIGIQPDDPRVVVLGADSDVHRAAAALAAAVEARASDASSTAIAQRLLAARYAVIVYETRHLGVHGALVIEMLQRVVATLNRSTRAAVLALGGGEGSATVNAVFTWLSGLPLRSRAGLHGIEHEPLLYDTERLLADGAVDLLLWIASYGTEAAPPASAARLPRIVLGHPKWAAADLDVYIPVATPGIGSDGHRFRTDGAVLMPLHALHALRVETLPNVADVLRAVSAAMPVEAAA